MKRFLSLIIATVSVLGFFVASSEAGDKVKIGYLPLLMSLPTFVAEEKGLFEREGLHAELIPFQSGTTIIDALVSGRIQVNACSAITGHWFAEQNVPGRFKIFLGYGTDSRIDNTFVAVVKKDSDIKGLEDLPGKRVGTFPGATSLALAKAVVRKETDPEKVIFMEIPPPNMVPALAAGKIDAFFTPEPFGMIAVSQRVGSYLMRHPLSLLEMKEGFAGGAFSFSSKFLKRSPQLAEKIRLAIDKALEYIDKNDEKARSYLPKYAHLPPPIASKIPFDKWFRIKDLNKAATQVYFDLLFNEGVYKKKLNTTELYYE